MNNTFDIFVKTVNDKVLTFKGVKSYEVKDGFIIFIDNYTGKTKMFSTSNVEIEQRGDDMDANYN